MTSVLMKIFVKAVLAFCVAATGFEYMLTHQPANLTGTENLGRPHAVGSLAWYQEHGYECWTSGVHPTPTHVWVHGHMLGHAAVARAMDLIFNHHQALSVVFCR